ncbi:trypsin-like peptidase domain-containing protein [Ktedonobacter sp. SOSP1-85]|uniref:trypsin-like peptidase domain-containing protein n=1 Tax=Ktedonobacter sp. SOSP1-85 TaxID=2778367 RepID=UPI001914E4DC|nr:trypsin-like peptidase domain-containing protein [Ktedonobacter sp. SOSP1-85]
MLLAGQHLNGTQRQLFCQTLQQAFDLNKFDQMLRDNLDKKVEDIIVPNGLGFPDIIRKVIERAEQESWTTQLLQAALSVRPDDLSLFKFAQQFGPVITTPPLKELVSKHTGLERAITPNPIYDLDIFMQRLYELASRICRIEDRHGTHLGTGFLVGPDRIITCYHVWEAAKGSENFVCYFTSEHPPYYLAEEPSIDLSFHNPNEDLSNILPSSEELDYALLRLAKAPGNQFIRYPYQDYPNRRGWITPSAQGYSFPCNASLYILHYPQTDPYSPLTLKLSLETNAIIGINKNRTRIRHRTNTAPGSSGAPCFTMNWELVALHHFGDPSDHPQYNQGIPFTAITKLLETRGHKDIFIPFMNHSSSEVCQTKGHEVAPNISSVLHSQRQASSSPREPSYPTHLEAEAPTFPPTNKGYTRDEASIDRNDLFDRLSSCLPGVFSKIITYCRAPDDIFSSNQASQAIRASELLKWAEGDGNVDLSTLHGYYLRACGKKTKQNRPTFIRRGYSMPDH